MSFFSEMRKAMGMPKEPDKGTWPRQVAWHHSAW
jgi:hypothetical protein